MVTGWEAGPEEAKVTVTDSIPHGSRVPTLDKPSQVLPEDLPLKFNILSGGEEGSG